VYIYKISTNSCILFWGIFSLFMSYLSPPSYNLSSTQGDLQPTTANTDSQPIIMENTIINSYCLQDSSIIKKSVENPPKPTFAQTNPKPLSKSNLENCHSPCHLIWKISSRQSIQLRHHKNPPLVTHKPKQNLRTSPKSLMWYSIFTTSTTGSQRW